MTLPSDLANREPTLCLGVDPFWSLLAMVATQDLVLRNYFRARIVLGQQYLPKEGAVVLAPTHRARWDALMLTMASGRRITGRDCRYMVTRSEMRGLQGWFLNRLGCFPVDQKRPSMTALRYAIDLMIDGQQLVMFPEGRINRFGEAIPLRQGLTRLVHLAHSKGVQVKVVPVGLGYSEVIPRPFGKAAICFSEPMEVIETTREGLLSFNNRLFQGMHSAEQAALRAVGRM